jgi:hypothetical protein
MRLAVALSAVLAAATTTQRGGCGKPPAPNPAAEACEGLACGAECTIEPACRLAKPPCLVPSLVGRCDAKGACVTTSVACGPPLCEGKRCGEPCTACVMADGTPCPSLVATACDTHGQCVPVTPGLCYDPCAGKTCGAACSPCPPEATGCAAIMCVTACDPTGRCVCAGGNPSCP